MTPQERKMQGCSIWYRPGLFEVRAVLQDERAVDAFIEILTMGKQWLAEDFVGPPIPAVLREANND